MNLYQITEITEKLNNAGTKANADIARIASEMGFRAVPVRMDTLVHSIPGKLRRQVGYFRDWRNAVDEIGPGSIVLLQHPFHHKQLTREKSLRAVRQKNVKFISVIHDIEELRGYRYSRYYKREFETMLELADVLIVHNDSMKSWMLERGVPEEKLVTLEVFDYLQKDIPGKKTFQRSVTVAGNLDTTKCGYVSELGKLENIKFNLYGANYDEAMRKYKDILYHGEFPMDVIPSKLTEGFGLVWDGSSVEGCRGEAGQYLRYNNPHKLSLYLSSGLPVVIWSGAAEADFVRKNGVGICVDSLTDLYDIFKDMQEADYRVLCENVDRLSGKLRSGEYARKALKEALRRIGYHEN